MLQVARGGRVGHFHGTCEHWLSQGGRASLERASRSSRAALATLIFLSRAFFFMSSSSSSFVHVVTHSSFCKTRRSLPSIFLPNPRRFGNCKSGRRAEMERERSNSTVLPEAVVGDPEFLEKKKAAIRSAGPRKLQVIADFDATLTKYWVNGCRGNTSHALLKQGNPEYDRKRQELYEYYHPLEFSPTIPIEEKTKLMEEWWGKTHGLLVEGGLTYDDIKKSVADAVIAFREGVSELFEFLEERDIPILIFSAGLADIIEEVLRQKLRRSFKNVRIVSNRMVFNDDGRLVGFKGKTIHVLNKNEHALEMAAPVHDHLGDDDGAADDSASVKKRTNVLLLGDHLGDLGMSDGLNYDNRIAVGFLNDNVGKSLQIYREAFDLVYLNDSSMLGVVELAWQICPMKE